MKTSTLLASARTACIVALLLPALASAQSDLTISGTFQASEIWGEVGPDLLPVYGSGQLHTWTLTMHGVTYDQDYFWVDWGGGQYEYQYSTRARSTSFVLEFFGPDEDLLNSVVSGQLTTVAVELVNGSYFDPYSDPVNGTPYLWFYLQAFPANSADGVQFNVSANNLSEFATFTYPTFEPQEIPWSYESIFDNRSGAYGEIGSYSLAVYIDSTEPPPPPTVRVSIADGSVLEGNKGTTALPLTVSLSSPVSEAVSVRYQTVDGTASSSGSRKSPADYTAASGTVTFQPGQTSRTITIAVAGDRKREGNETLTVQIFAPAGPVVIGDAIATATILNDD